jgi:hypothetical protein
VQGKKQVRRSRTSAELSYRFCFALYRQDGKLDAEILTMMNVDASLVICVIVLGWERVSLDGRVRDYETVGSIMVGSIG